MMACLELGTRSVTVIEHDRAVLVGDIERRNAFFAVAQSGRGPFIDLKHVTPIDTRRYKSLEDALSAYVDTLNVRPDAIALAIAGPIHQDVIRLRDSDWTIRRDQLGGRIGVRDTCFMNDFEAMARGATLAPSTDFETVAEGVVDFTAPIVVLGPGEGLGMSIVQSRDGRIEPTPTEGGHAPFAPRTDLEAKLWRLIVDELGCASYEDVLSEKGIQRIHRVLRAENPARPDSEIAVATLEIFCQVLGTFTSAAVVTSGARGGVILGGALLADMPHELLATHFLERFYCIGRMSPYLERVPVRLIRSRAAVLLGAASAYFEATAVPAAA